PPARLARVVQHARRQRHGAELDRHGMTALIVVSNRGPVTYERDDSGARVERRGGGGLATALRGLRERSEVTWIASATTDEDRVVAGAGKPGDDLVLLAHDPAAYDGYYNTIAN